MELDTGRYGFEYVSIACERLYHLKPEALAGDLNIKPEVGWYPKDCQSLQLAAHGGNRRPAAKG
jgi:hypothetical protein